MEQAPDEAWRLTDDGGEERVPRCHLRVGDEVIATGPDTGRERLAEMFGWRFEADEETGEHELAQL